MTIVSEFSVTPEPGTMGQCEAHGCVLEARSDFSVSGSKGERAFHICLVHALLFEALLTVLDPVSVAGFVWNVCEPDDLFMTLSALHDVTPERIEALCQPVE